MKILYFLIILIAIGVFLFKNLIQNRKVEMINDNSQKLPYKKRDYLLTKAERSFYEVLSFALKDKDFLIFSKVRLADLLYIPKGNNYMTYFNKIQSKHIDFVICDTKFIKPLIAIELDDSSHSKDKRSKRDDFVEKALSDADFPLLRFPVKSSYNTIEILNKIEEIIYPVKTKTDNKLEVTNS